MSEQAVPQALVGKPQHRCSFKHNPDKAFGLVALLFWALLLASAGVMGLENSSPAALRLVELEGEIARDYAGVTHISVATLKSDFADALLVDVRAASEYERSHLPGALHAPTSAHVDALRQRYPERDLVLYCTVGVRSSIAVRDLLAREIASTEGASSGPAGASSAPAGAGGRVVNLAGSIFAWANQGEPLENANGPTHDVHPYNAWWGFRYLDRNRPLLEPESLPSAEETD